MLWRMEVNGDWRCLSPLKASGLDLVFTPPCSALSKADYSLIIDCLSPKSAVSFPLAWPVLLPGGTWFGVFWSPCNVPTDQPDQLSAGYFDSLVSAGRSFSPSSPLMHGNKDLPNLSQFLMEHTGVLPSSTASCKPPVALLGTDVEVRRGVSQPPSGDVGSQLESGGFAGVCAVWALHVSCDRFPVPLMWAPGSQVLCLTGGNEGAEVRWNSVPVSCNDTSGLCFIFIRHPPTHAGSQVLGECTQQSQNEKIKTSKDNTAPFLILFMASLNHFIMENINIAYYY